MAPFQILRAFRLLAILWMAVSCVSEEAIDWRGRRVATVGFPTIYQGAATLRTSRTNRFTYTVAGLIDHVDTVDSSGTLRTTYYKYDDARRRRQADSPEGVMTWQRDAAGNIIATQGYRRSAVGANAELTNNTPTDIDIAYGYDAMNRLNTVMDRKLSTNRSLAYGYDAAGRLQTASYPNGVTNRFVYDTRHRLVRSEWWLTNGAFIRAYGYSLGAGGVRTNLLEYTTSALTTTRREVAWQYDLNGTTQLSRLYRLTGETITTAGMAFGTEQHRYDAVGNRTNRSITGFSGITNLSAGTWTYNLRDGLNSESYDGAGNTTTGASVIAGYLDWYDAENHLIQRTTSATNSVLQMGFDAFGNRVSKTMGTTNVWYLIDDQSPSGYAQVVGEFNSLANAAPVRTYAYGLSLIEQIASSTTRYALTDGQGSVRALFDDTAAANLTDSYDYDAFWVLTTITGSTVNNYRYTGHQWDPDLQLYYLRARYYAPTLGRFWSSDSFEGNFQEPGSLHRYSYCHQDPVNSIDFSGNIPVMSNFVYGQRVHDLIGENFLATGIDRSYDESIGAILKLPSIPYLTASRPDLVQRPEGGNPGEVYEIKPTASFIEGQAQLQYYLLLLKALDPQRRQWNSGSISTYTPPTVIPLGWGCFAIVSPPIRGVILYHIEDLLFDAVVIGAYGASQIKSELLEATLIGTLAPAF